MKKNISINISGIIFHIEEDGYDTLKNYLDAINHYFSSYEDSEEIIADIEGRIAEIFLGKLKEGNQVVSAADVDALIKTMGSIADFEAVKEEEFETSGEEDKKTENRTGQYTTKDNTSKTQNQKGKVYRDLNRRVLGGVASGLGHYYNVDPLWIRVGILLMFFGNIPLFALGIPLSGLTLIAYFVLWAVFPGSDTLEENKKLKKLYRDPDDRVIGGVAGGLAKYFNTEPLIIRIVFIVLFFGVGTGLLAYIILWIITPNAHSITDKMQMKGEPVTLSNIDSTIKKNKEEAPTPKDEGTFTKVLLFPFRLIGRMFSGVSKALSPLMLFIVDVIRVFTGGIIAIVGISVMFSLLVTAGVLLGLYHNDGHFINDDWGYFPYELIHNSIPEVGIIFLLAALFIPFLFIFIAGVTVIAKRKVMSTSVGWSIFGIWLFTIVGTAMTIPNTIRDFREEGIYRESESFEVSGDVIWLKMDRDRYDDFDAEFIDLDIRATDGQSFKLDKRFIARGRTVSAAEENAQMITYSFNVEDSILNFGSSIRFKEQAKFRAQELDLTLYIPKNRPFKVGRGMDDLFHYFPSRYRYSWWEVYRNTWMYTGQGLVCVTCDDDKDKTSSSGGSNQGMDTFYKLIDTPPFQGLSVKDNLDITLVKGSDFQVKIEGEEYEANRIKTSVRNEVLEVYADVNERERLRDVKVTVTAPSLHEIEARHSSEISISDFDGATFRVSLTENAILELNSTYGLIELNLEDNAKLSLVGNFDQMEGKIGDNARLYAYEAITRDATIETRSEARARVHVTNFLKVDARGFSSVRYKGKPELEIVNEGRSANISAY